MCSAIPDDILDRLADCKSPHLIGVRHHSAALSRVMPELLSQIRPDAVLIEMPTDFHPWMEHLTKEDLVAPVALAASDAAQLVSFYPLADFSPELAAIRWAAAAKVPVIPCDLDLVSMRRLDVLPSLDDDSPVPSDQLESLFERFRARNLADLWETLVETPACQSTAEQIRRASLYFGWLSRHSSCGPSVSDTYRELAMRNAIAAAPSNSVAVIGAFHAAALLPEPVLWTAPEPLSPAQQSHAPIVTSLVPYSFAQLDHRSGYPAGIKDPVWQQTMLSGTTPLIAQQLVADMAVELCRELRSVGHVAGTPDAIEVVRLATDLGRLRGHKAPGRGEFLEAIETCLVQSDLYGRGRAVASAAQKTLVGMRRGRLPKGTPKSGLAHHVEEMLKRLKLPGPDESDNEWRELRLDPLRSALDRSRAVVLRRMNLSGILYAERFDTQSQGDRVNLTEAWRVRWTNATASTVEAAGVHGITLTQACEAAIRRLRGDIDPLQNSGADAEHPDIVLMRLTAAAECGLHQTVHDYLTRVDQDFVAQGSLDQLVQAAILKQRMSSGYISGLPVRHEDAAPPDVPLFQAAPQLLAVDLLLDAALRRLDGLVGSDQQTDVITLVDLTAIIRGDFQPALSSPDVPREESRLRPALVGKLMHLQRHGSARMQGAAWGALVLLNETSRDQLDAAQAGWYDGASISEGRKHLSARLQGLLEPLAPIVALNPEWLGGLEARLATSTDDDFLVRLPALRGGFQLLPPDERARLLSDRMAMLEPGGHASNPGVRIEDPLMTATVIAADRAGRAAIAALLPEFPVSELSPNGNLHNDIENPTPPGEIGLADRWRLILAVKGCQSNSGQRLARALDELYGRSTSEGTSERADLANSGGTEKPAPAAREWIEEVRGLFEKDVCEEVIGQAAGAGRAALLEHLNPATMPPSVELLRQVLSLRGALPERELAHLRKLARSITEKLAKQLANRLRPALSGLSTARPTRKRSRRIDFARTLNLNLNTAYRADDGRIRLAPSRLVFRGTARRQMDWHLIFVVDVSGSMEASVIYSALVAAIFSALPAIDVRFFAFSTELVDLSNSVDDPLALLMEVRVGGGTHIGLGLRAAREAMKNPSRTLVVLVTDFYEGVSIPELLAEVRILADSGAKLIGLAALDNEAKPRYHGGTTSAVVSAGMPVAAVSPERLAQWVGDQIRGGSR